MITYEPIGVVRSPYKEPSGTPIQPSGADSSVAGSVEISPGFSEALKDLDGFSHIILLYHLHRAGPVQLLVTPFLDNTEPRGLFATRAPVRPNPIGLSVVSILGIHGNVIDIGNADILDGSPVLDIKPYVPAFDAPDNVRCGWLDEKKGQVNRTRDDGRFTD